MGRGKESVRSQRPAGQAVRRRRRRSKLRCEIPERTGGVLMRRTLLVFVAACLSLPAQVAIQGDTVYTMAGAPLRNAVVLLRDGRIEKVGPAAQTPIPSGYRTL